MEQAYQTRLLDALLLDYLQELPAIAIDGAKAVGKTSTASRLVQTIYHVDEELVRELLMNDFSMAEAAKKPVLLDEWQFAPPLWNRVRRAVDDDVSPGQYVLAGSSYPAGAKIHSGAGRLVHVRMRPLSLFERHLADPAVSLRELLAGKAEQAQATTKVSYGDYLREIFQSGFPGLRSQSPHAVALQLDSYIESVINREFVDQGVRVRKLESLRAWMRAYAAASASTAAYETIRDGASGGQNEKPAANTTLAYRDLLACMWLIDPIDPWLPTDASFKDLGKTPKHYLVDCALAARLLDITEDTLLEADAIKVLGPQKKSIIGRLFESLLAQSLQVYAQINEARLRHFRSSNGRHEVDFIIERGRQVVAIEAKSQAEVTAADARHLNWLAGAFPERHITKVILYTGAYAYTREDGVRVIPAALLGP